MRYWKISFQGIWLGGTVIAIADNKVVAEAMAMGVIIERFPNLTGKTGGLNAEEIHPKDGILYVDDGGYW